jgi:hypothetical protein
MDLSPVYGGLRARPQVDAPLSVAHIAGSGGVGIVVTPVAMCSEGHGVHWDDRDY